MSFARVTYLNEIANMNCALKVWNAFLTLSFFSFCVRERTPVPLHAGCGNSRDVADDIDGVSLLGDDLLSPTAFIVKYLWWN